MNHQGSLPHSPVTIVVVSGAIGVGKSTLLDVLSASGYDVLPEPVDLWRERGWLQEFYEDQRGKAFWFQQAVYESSIANVERKLAELAGRGGTRVIRTHHEHDSLPRLYWEDVVPVGHYVPMRVPDDINETVPPRCIKMYEEDTLSTKTTPRRGVVFVERYIYDQLCFWQTNVLMGNGSRAEDDVYMSFWQRWRRFIPEPKGYILLRGDTHVEERGRREEITASKDEGFARYQAKLDEMHCAFFAEPLAHPEQTAERIRTGFWDSPSADSAPLAPSRQGIPCMHLKVSDFPYHKDEDAKAGVVEHIEAWLTKNRLTW